MPDAEGRPTSPEDAAQMLRENWEKEFQARKEAFQESEQQRYAMLRSEGIEGVADVTDPTGQALLVARGPDVTGRVSLFLMNDGTVRWRRA